MRSVIAQSGGRRYTFRERLTVLAVAMSTTAFFRFHGELETLLTQERRRHPFASACARAATLKNAIEALGVPHTEVGAVSVNGAPATLARIVRDGDAIEVYPWVPGSAAPALRVLCFLADAHLGGLARFLRMLGFDTIFDPALDDTAIQYLAHDDQRVVLTRDRELLKRREIPFGCFIRRQRPDAQLQEVAIRYGLAASARPFTRCLHCNMPLASIGKADVLHRLPDAVRERHTQFAHCRRCDRVYWPGTHFEHMRTVLRNLLPALRESV